MAVPCTPSDLVAAAKCFACIPKSARWSVRSKILCETAIKADPTTPCSAPSAPTNVGPLNETNTTIKIAWKQPKNTGSFISGYIVYWGTTSGGPYTNNSGLIGIVPKNYTITGLTSGTTYYFVVVAQTNVPGCVSVNSVEGHDTTTGNPPNGLLNSLVHFYQFQEAASLFADSGSDPIGLQYTDGGLAFARVAGHVQAFAGSYNGNNAEKIGTIAPAPFDYTGDGTGNIPMTWMLWFRLTGVSGAQPATSTLMSCHSPGYYFAWINTNFLQFNIMSNNGPGPLVTINAAFVYDNNWHMLVGGFDKVGGVMFFSIDGGAKLTTPLAQATSTNAIDYAIGNCGSCGGNCPNFQFSDCGTWLNRALTAANIAALWNGGAGLPFNQFTV